jgi:hypothetical protein
LILTATSLGGPAVMPVALLTGAILEAEIEILEWNNFFSRLLDPRNFSTSEDLVWMILLQIEDWDHFLEHARNPSVAPSLELLEQKTGELAYLLGSIGNHPIGRLFVGLLPPPEEVGRNGGLMAFREKLCDGLRDSLSDYSSICVCGIPDKPPSPQETEETASGEALRMVYRIPLNTQRRDK